MIASVPISRFNRLVSAVIIICIAGIEARTSLPAEQATVAPSQSGAADPFKWLEGIESDRALAWVKDQNERTLNRFTNNAGYQRDKQIALAIRHDKSRLPAATRFHGMLHDGWVYDLWQDEAHERGLWRRARLNSFLKGAPAWEPLVDIDALGRTDRVPRAYQAPTPCYRQRCIVRMGSRLHGSIYREFDLTVHAFVQDGFVWQGPAEYQHVAWKNENKLLIAANWGPGTLTRAGQARILKEWSRGQALSAAKEIFRGEETDLLVYPDVIVNELGERLITIVRNIDGWQKVAWKLDETGVPTLLALPPFGDVRGLHKGEFIIWLYEDWESGGTVWKAGSLISMPVTEVTQRAPTVRLITEAGPREAIAGGASVTRDGLLVPMYENVRGRLLLFTFKDGRWRREPIAFPDHGTVDVIMSDPTAGTAFGIYETFLQPRSLYAIDVASRRARRIKSASSQFDSSRYVTEQFEAVSKDATRVPYFIVRPRSLALNGQTPVLMEGYGALGAMRTPHYDGVLGRLWLDRGGLYVLANVRGGGELGPAWHVTRTGRQHTYEDFIAVAEDLIRRKLTSPRRLGIRGHSNGGLLVAVTLNMRPDLFQAAVLEHPVLDIHAHVKGMNSPEYGSWDDPIERVFLERTSPLQNLRRQAGFPMPFVKTATDDSVPPWMARKYVAKLASFDLPYFYFESPEGGHSVGGTAAQSAAYDALVYNYLADRLM